MNAHSVLCNMASRMNWRTEETDKFIELLCETKAKGKDISFSKLREQMKAHGYPARSDQQLKNHYDGWGRKIKVLDQLLSLTGVGWDPVKELPVVDDERWEEIVAVRMLYIYLMSLQCISLCLDS